MSNKLYCIVVERPVVAQSHIDWLGVRSPLEEVKYLFTFHFFALVSRQSAVLSSATQLAMPPEFGGKWRTECLNTRFSLPTLLCAGYRVKLKEKSGYSAYNQMTRDGLQRIFGKNLKIWKR